MGVEVTLKNITYHFLNIYIKSNITDIQLSSDLEKLALELENLENTIICGDINIAHPTWENNCRKTEKKSDTFQEFIQSNSLITINTGEPTYLHERNSRAIDTISTLNLFDQVLWEVSDNCNSDHLLIIIKLKRVT